MFAALLPILSTVVDKVAGNLFPDPVARAKASQELMVELLKYQSTIDNAAGQIIKAEASSGNWLASSWRPITMLTFVCLIVARMFGYTAEGITEAEYLELWSLVKLGLGGYVVGRSVEKIAPGITAAVANRK